RALLGDRRGGEDAASPTSALSPRGALAQAPPVRKRRAPSPVTRPEHRVARTGCGLRGHARAPARPAACRARRRRHCALLRARDVGDRRRSVELRAPRRADDLGHGGRDALNRAADVAIAGAALVVASPLLGLAALAAKLEGRGP